MELEPGTVVADYEIVRHVKSGGMASLYLARRRGAAGFQKVVALKLVHEELGQDEAFIRMFLDEARLAARIEHPNVVHVEELREIDGHYVLAMEYVDGVSLASMLSGLSRAGRPLPPEIAVWIAVQMADGLHAAHELRGDDGALLHVVHRDVSPQNVLVSRDGHVKIIDFGIAKSRLASERTRVGVVRGKLQYMSPEHARGEHLDRRADVFAVGVLLWEMLTMRRLFFAADERELLRLVQAPTIRRPSELAPVGPRLDAVVMNALAVDPDARTSTALELREQLLEAYPRAGSVHAAHVAALIAPIVADREAPAAPARDAVATRATPRGAGPILDASELAELEPDAVAGPPARFARPPRGKPLRTTLVLLALAAIVGIGFYLYVISRLGL